MLFLDIHCMWRTNAAHLAIQVKAVGKTAPMHTRQTYRAV